MLCAANCLQSYISIHVPRVGDDPCNSFFNFFCDISIHVPRVGDDVQSGQ